MPDPNTKWSEVPHKFVEHRTYTGPGCAMCGRPETDAIHQVKESNRASTTE